MMLALGFIAGFLIGTVLTGLCAVYFFGLLRDDMAGQLDGYGAMALFTSARATRREDRTHQGCLP